MLQLIFDILLRFLVSSRNDSRRTDQSISHCGEPRTELNVILFRFFRPHARRFRDALCCRLFLPTPSFVRRSVRSNLQN